MISMRTIQYIYFLYLTIHYIYMGKKIDLAALAHTATERSTLAAGVELITET